MTQFEQIIRRLVEAQIKFVVIGGLAARAQGSAYITQDVDVCYQRTSENLKKMTGFLKSVDAKLRVARDPGNLLFLLDEKSLSMGMNFTFETSLGALDILGEVSGIGTYEKALELSQPIDLYGFKINVLSVEGLIRSKKAAGRTKDLLLLKELEALQEIKNRAKETKT